MLLKIPAPDSLSSILGIIIVLSVIPVYNAKETLPTEKIHERQMKEHINEIGELVRKSEKKEIVCHFRFFVQIRY